MSGQQYSMADMIGEFQDIDCDTTRLLRDLINDPAFIARHRHSDTDFTRQRTLPFPVVVLFLLNLIKGALQRELDEFFQVLPLATWPTGWSPRARSAPPVRS